jgi:RHS repeat-associated protein
MGEITPTFRARAQVDRPLAVVNAVNTTPVTWYVHVDHLARPIKMTTAAKASVWDAVWQPWGGQHTITGTAVLDARFPGQWFQLETGLHYNWHRSYDPSIGRYTQADPLGFVDGPSVYAYAMSAALIWVDPRGLQAADGHHYFPNQIRQQYPFSPEVMEYFKGQKTGPIPQVPENPNRGSSGPHRDYNPACKEAMDRFLSRNNIAPGQLSLDQAKDFMKTEIHQSKDPRIRDFNGAIRSLIVKGAAGRSGRGE